MLVDPGCINIPSCNGVLFHGEGDPELGGGRRDGGDGGRSSSGARRCGALTCGGSRPSRRVIGRPGPVAVAQRGGTDGRRTRGFRLQLVSINGY